MKFLNSEYYFIICFEWLYQYGTYTEELCIISSCDYIKRYTGRISLCALLLAVVMLVT